MGYYERPDVRQTIIGFAKAGNGRAVRECAFYNTQTKSLQRHFNGGKEKKIVVFDSEQTFELALAKGASAFYCSYWRYEDPREPQHPAGHDLVWTVRAASGGLGFAKAVTKEVLEALSDWVDEPWVKYSGELGFDLMLPLEAIPGECWAGEVGALSDVQRGLTDYIVSYLIERDFSVGGFTSPFRIEQASKTCLLSELRVRRGLLLAPMSLNPRSGLVSLPLDPARIEGFSALDASQADAKPCEWKF